MHNKKLSLLIGAVLLFLPHYVLADCFPAVIQACNTSLQVPMSGEGTVITLTMPSPYVRQQFTTECIDGGYMTDESALTCELEMCGDGAVNVCGEPVMVPGGTVVGQNVDVEIPPPSHSVYQTSDRTFTTQCVDNGNGVGIYQAENEINIACSAFPCPDAELNICGEPVDIPGGAALGDVLNLTAPAPYMADPFQVQCLASNGNAPVYELTDYSSVSCIEQNSSE